MEKEVKEMQSEQVRQKARMGAGAWVTGESLKEESTTGISPNPRA